MTSNHFLKENLPVLQLSLAPAQGQIQAVEAFIKNYGRILFIEGQNIIIFGQ